jgi:TonB family protein
MMPALTTANLLAWSIQVAVIVFIGGAAVRAASLQSPRVRLACFRALLIACFVLPFLAVGPELRVAAPGTASPRASRTTALPAGTLSVDVTPANASPESSATSRAAGGLWPQGPIAVVAGVILGLGVAARLMWLVVGLVALRRLRRDGQPVHSRDPVGAELGLARRWAETSSAATIPAIDRAVDLVGARAEILISPAVKHPVTFGGLRPVVLLPDSYASLDETEQAAVVCHELLHVRRGDWLHTVVEEILRAVLWFHPAIWWLLGQVDLSREQLVDQEVVTLTEHRQPYLNALVTLALTPAGPILRPASLFLGRAHLLQRVALLSREVRMSRPRLVASLVVITVALVFGGRFVVQAFPLAPLVTSQAVPAPVPAPAPMPTPVAGAPAPLPQVAVAAPGPESPIAANAPQATTNTSPRVAQRAEPVVAPQTGQSAEDAIIVIGVTIDTTGALTGPIEVTSLTREQSPLSMKGSDIATTQSMLDSGFARQATSQAQYDRLRAAFDALRLWRFEPVAAPVRTAVGFNFARTEQSGLETEPVRIGGNIRQPAKVRDVKPVYPGDAQAKGIQGVVILELVVDGAGIPIDAYAIRPIEGLSMAAVQAALQWRFEPEATYMRRLMTVTVNFNLGGVTGGLVAGAPSAPPPPPPPPDVVGGIVGAGLSFGPPPAEWPQPVRVGGDIKQPTELVDVRPVYPREAQDARVQGVVIIETLIGPDGRVQAGRILRSIPLLDQAALDAVRQWEFTPTLLNGVPVPIVMTVTVNFTLA